jgi:hypothetical protein
VSAADLSLGLKLFHLQVALEHFKGWKIPETLTSVHAYTEVHQMFTELGRMVDYQNFCHFQNLFIAVKLLSFALCLFVQALFTKESFVKTQPAREHLIAGWAPKVNP